MNRGKTDSGEIRITPHGVVGIQLFVTLDDYFARHPDKKEVRWTAADFCSQIETATGQTRWTNIGVGRKINQHLPIEVPQIIIHQTDQPDIVGNLFDPDGLSSKDLAKVDFFAAQADAATARCRRGQNVACEGLKILSGFCGNYLVISLP